MTLCVVALLSLSACDKFLDVMPDNRAEIDTQSKIRALITSAYPSTDYLLLSEFLSDNVDDYGEDNPSTDRFIDQVYAWQDVTEEDNESPEMLWGNSYIAIAAANQAIQAIEDLGGAEKAGLEAELAEALLCRAYNHFILVNMFAQAYNTETSTSDAGVTYMLKPETQLNPKYERNTVAEVYDYIDKDLQTALKYVSDSYYQIPKYHFNTKAAYAFAARFYLYYGKYEESVKYADMVLGSAPASMLRDWKTLGTMVQDPDAVCLHFVDASVNSNLMLVTAYSALGLCFGPYNYYSRYAHGNYLATREDGLALCTLFGMTNNSFYHSVMKVYRATNLDKTIFWKIPYLFEFTDPVAQIGYYRAVYPAFTGDQTLLERAEAKILLKQYSSAVEDMNIWLTNISKASPVTAEEINTMMNGTYQVPGSKIENDTLVIKKKLNPKFVVEPGIQENLIHYCLLLKRVDGLQQGLRWFDVKRYGIEIERRVISADGLSYTVKDKLTVDDLRRAIQIPKKVIDAGYDPNPRKNSNSGNEKIEPVL